MTQVGDELDVFLDRSAKIEDREPVDIANVRKELLQAAALALDDDLLSSPATVLRPGFAPGDSPKKLLKRSGINTGCVLILNYRFTSAGAAFTPGTPVAPRPRAAGRV